MSQSLTRLYAHLVFSTKNRHAFLDETIRSRVHGYLASVIRDLESPWVVVGGVADHVHILFDMGKKSIIENLHFQTNTVQCFDTTTLTMMNNTSGIELAPMPSDPRALP